jgi:hypothetical protein
MHPEHLSDKFITKRKRQLVPPYPKKNWQFDSILFDSRNDSTDTFEAELFVHAYST